MSVVRTQRCPAWEAPQATVPFRANKLLVEDTNVANGIWMESDAKRRT